jgi:glycosyltransferase involved in cell wall biosynthesis
MNILYITNLSTNVAAGLNWSVPARVKAQEKIDDCLWVNLSNVEMEHWHEIKCFHNLQEFGEKISLKILPAPFNHPDVVVFEGFYHPKDPKFAHELRHAHVPYIIVPRGSLTKQALSNHAKWKKRIAHVLIFDFYAHKAKAIQYLTENEYKASGDKWNKNSFVLSNGFSTPSVFKQSFHNDQIKATFIGRLDMFHKGIDVLLEACDALKDELRAVGFNLCFYGPKRYDYYLIEKTIIKKGLSDFISMGGEITGEPKKQLLLSSDLFVLTSRFEGHPMGLIEALAYGVPVVVTPSSNMAKEIREANAGWSCNDVTVEEITKMLRQVIAECNQLTNKSKNAIELAKTYDWSKLAEKFHSELCNLLE